MSKSFPTFADARIEQDTPGKPDCTGEVERLFFLNMICRSTWISRFKSAKRTKTIQKVQA